MILDTLDAALYAWLCIGWFLVLGLVAWVALLALLVGFAKLGDWLFNVKPRELRNRRVEVVPLPPITHPRNRKVS